MAERLSPPARLALVGSLLLNSACSGVNTFSVTPTYKPRSNGFTYGFQITPQNGPVSSVEIAFHENGISLWKSETYQLPGGGQTTTLDGIGLWREPATSQWSLFNTYEEKQHY